VSSLSIRGDNLTTRKNPIKFGTDGWRAIIAEDFTFENVRYCAEGVAAYLKHKGLDGRGIVIGYDTRFASEDFAAATAEVLAGNGIKVYLCPRTTPTPVISYGVLARQAGGGIIITASHNPGVWNGFKFKDENGSSASDEKTALIERNIAAAFNTGRISRLPLAEAKKQGLVEETDLDPIYFKQVAGLVDLEAVRRAGLKIVVDPMYGAGAGYLARLLDGGTTEIIEINAERNPLFPGIRPEPIAPNLSRLSEAVNEKGAQVGLATDGDADRMGVVDENGVFITQLQVFALLCLYLLEVRGERGPLVKTLTTTSMAYRLGEIFDVPVYETAVGFKYVAPLMMKEQAIIGGEESGGYGFRNHVAERDGILANLYFLDFMVKTGKKPSDLIEYLYSKVGPHHYKRVDIKFPQAEHKAIVDRVKSYHPEKLDNVKVVKLDTTDGFRFILEDTTWLLIRFSGTEPLLRIYSETDSPERAERLLEIGREIAGV
jgi:alpha-D-glucose phosphate-specific phosphoglucomutase